MWGAHLCTNKKMVLNQIRIQTKSQTRRMWKLIYVNNSVLFQLNHVQYALDDVQSEAKNYYSMFFIDVVVDILASTFVKCSTVMQWKLFKQHVIIVLHTLSMITIEWVNMNEAHKPTKRLTHLIVIFITKLMCFICCAGQRTYDLWMPTVYICVCILVFVDLKLKFLY